MKHSSKGRGTHGSPRHTESYGGGPGGAEEQDRVGPGKSFETRGKPDTSSYPMDASSGKGIKPANHTRGREEDE